MKKLKLKEFQKNILKRFTIRLAVFLAISAVLLTSLSFSTFFENILNQNDVRFDQNILNANLRVHFVDVGQGDCTIIELPDDKVFVIDTGCGQVSQNVERYLNNIIFKNKKNKQIDFLLLTHTDLDHIGGAVSLLNNFVVKKIFIPKVYSSFEVKQGLNTQDFNVVDSLYWANTMRAVRNEVKIEDLIYSQEGIKIESDLYSFDFYAPFEENFINTNNYSPIVMLACNNFKFLFVGDIEGEIEEDFLIRYRDEIDEGLFDCTVLKVAHHGSKNSSCLDFLQAVSPEICVVSCGKNNSYNHPSNETINRIVEVNSEILRTDTMGSILLWKNENVLSQFSGYNFVSDFYFEWWTFVLSGIILSFCVLCLAKQKG